MSTLKQKSAGPRRAIAGVVAFAAIAVITVLDTGFVHPGWIQLVLAVAVASLGVALLSL